MQVKRSIEDAERERSARLSRARKEADSIVMEGLATVDREVEDVFQKSRADTRRTVETRMAEGRARLGKDRLSSEARLQTAVDRLIEEFQRSIKEG